MIITFYVHYSGFRSCHSTNIAAIALTNYVIEAAIIIDLVDRKRLIMNYF